ncbi:Protein O-mannosyltransferase 2, partial [Coemansia sp. S610]
MLFAGIEESPPPFFLLPSGPRLARALSSLPDDSATVLAAAMSGTPKSTSVFYDQAKPGSRFDDMHLPQRPAGFSAYPLSDKEGDSSAAAYANLRPVRGHARWNWSSDRILLVLLTLLAIFTKVYRIGRRDSVSWDESHFYKNFSQKYLRHLFHHDVHPPLAKMLIAFSNYLADSNGTYTFDGGDYPAF